MDLDAELSTSTMTSGGFRVGSMGSMDPPLESAKPLLGSLTLGFRWLPSSVSFHRSYHRLIESLEIVSSWLLCLCLCVGLSVRGFVSSPVHQILHIFVSGELQVLKVGRCAFLAISKISLHWTQFFRYDKACSP